MMASRMESGVGVLLLDEPGGEAGQVVSLDREVTLLGRDSSCDVILKRPSVSRRHARITRGPDGSGYFLEDLLSTSGTRLNSRRLEGGQAVRLQDGDFLRIGDCAIQFRESGDQGAENGLDLSETTILGERDATGSEQRRLVDERSEVKLRAMLDIGRELAGVYDLDAVLGRVLATLLGIFPQAERGLVLMKEADAPPVLRAFRDRRGGATHPRAQFSRTIVENVLGRGKAVLCTDIADDARFDPSRSAVDAPCRTMMCVPLRDSQQRSVGLLQLDTALQTGSFSHEDLDLLIAVAGPVSVAVDNARLLQESQRAREEAEAANRAKDRFLAVLSHELRTPLTPVLIATSALLDDGPPSDLRPTLEMIRRNIVLEARLIDDLLDLTRITHGRLRLDRRQVDVHDAVRQALSVCRQAILEAGLDLTLDLEAPGSLVEGDPTRLQQIVWNLLQNAVKFTPQGGLISIRSREIPGPAGASPGRLLLEVRDTGIGIEPSVLERIFDPFEQVGADSSFRTRGLGLGLAISRNLALAHGGNLIARSHGLGHGAVFALELPLSDTAVRAPEANSRARLAPSRNASRSGAPLPPLRLLLVEDNRDTLNSLSLVLRSRGHTVTPAEDLATARAALRESRFDLLISDVELPDGSGRDLMRELGGRARAGIAMSGFGTEEDLRMSSEAGFALHLTKPILASQLQEAIGQILPTLQVEEDHPA